HIAERLAFSFSTCYPRHRDLPSFPTRRSSDLADQFTSNWLGIVFVSAIPFGITGGVISDRLGRKIFVYLSGAAQSLVAIVFIVRSEEHTSELQSRFDLVCRLLLEKKKETLRMIDSTGSDSISWLVFSLHSHRGLRASAATPFIRRSHQPTGALHAACHHCRPCL